MLSRPTEKRMKFFTSLLNAIFTGKTSAKKNVIILGTDYPEYKLSKALSREGACQILFFIESDPWRHKTRFDNATCKYLTELTALCEKHNIEHIYYVDNKWLDLVDPDLRSLLLKAP